MSTIEILWLILKIYLVIYIILELYENYLDRKLKRLGDELLREFKILHKKHLKERKHYLNKKFKK